MPYQTKPFFYGRATWDSYHAGGRWVFSQRGVSAIRWIALGGTMSTLTTTNQPVQSFAYVHTASTNMVYYCSLTGVLYKKDLGTAIESALSWPISSMTCKGRSMLYNSTRNSLIFPYTQNGLDGIVEYLNP